MLINFRDRDKFILPISILLGCIILGSFYYASQIYKQKFLREQNQDLQIKLDKQNKDQLGERCYSHEDKKCITKEEKEIVKLLPSNAILREVRSVPSLGIDEFDVRYIGIYIENPVVEETRPDDDYLSCYDSVRGQGIAGIYHFFTYSPFGLSGEIVNDVIIPRSTAFNNDYNKSIQAQRIKMSWQNTKWNNFYHFSGKPYQEDEQFDLEISSLINFKDYNGDGIPHEFILYGGEYGSCSWDENLIAGYDDNSRDLIIYKIKDESGELGYWGVNFFPDKNGDVLNKWPCGDHGSEVETTVYYKYNSIDKYYYLVNNIVKKCN